ncbi:hypothetical protein JBL43_19760 [Aureibaculum sp. A20]|uniref:Uncharacterized protein n=1 Tax=Aureibaculum flavum TaxID=2795986 RepID=A0ABS0WWZ3_9FLAO|nr:hypothetical protein [Aureibaculum flavum]MBJ2176495.1 hypothetical protein [Aureibaculum flavum]
MEHKNIRLIIIVVTAFTLLSAGCSISITKNYYGSESKTPIKTKSTTYAFKLGTQSLNPNYVQR